MLLVKFKESHPKLIIVYNFKPLKMVFFLKAKKIVRNRNIERCKYIFFK